MRISHFLIIWSKETKIELFGNNDASHTWRVNGSAYYMKNTIPTVKHRRKHDLELLFFMRDWNTRNIRRKDEWSHIKGYFGEGLWRKWDCLVIDGSNKTMI